MIRKSCSHCWSLAIYCLNFLLAGIVCALAYVLLSNDIPVPGILVDRIEAELHKRGLEVTVKSARFDPTGKIFVTGLQLQPERFGESIFEASRALVSLNRLKLLALQPDLAELEVEDVRLICPSSLSPSGVPEAVARIAAARLRHEGGLWTLDSAIAQIDEVVVTAHGAFTAAPPREKKEPPGLETLLKKFSEFAPQAVKYEQLFARVTHPLIQLEFSGSSNTGIEVEAQLFADSVYDATYGEARQAHLTARARFAPAGDPHIVVSGGVGEISHPQYGRAADLRIQAEWETRPVSGKPLWPDRIRAAIGTITHPKATIDGAVLTVWPAGFPEVEARAFAAFEGETLAATLTGNLETRSGEVALQTRLGRNWLAAASRALGRDVTYYATVETPPDIVAHALLEPGSKLREVSFRVLSGPILTRGVHLDRARVRGHATLENVHIEHLEIQRGDEWAIGSYADHLPTRDTRFLLHGALRPMSIAPWFGDWWGRFWGEFEFLGPPPDFDVDIRNNWLARDAYRIAGNTRAEMLSLRGVTVNWLRSAFRVQHNYYDLFEASIGRTEGRIDGNVQLLYRTGQRDPLRQTWEFKSTADLREMARIFGEGGVALFEPYAYEIPPAVAAKGDIINDDGTFDMNIHLALASENEFRYYDFPVDTIATDVTIRNDHITLPNLRATYAEGLITADAVVDKGILTVKAKLADADYDEAVARFNAFLDSRSPPPPDAAAPSGFAAREINGRLDLEVSAVGPLTDFTGYEGTGKVAIRNGDLAQFRLFGPIGDILSPIGIRIGNLKLTDAQSDFEIRKNELIFPNLRFTGTTEAIQGEGSYRIPDGALSFKMRLYPLRESNGALTQLFGVLLDPFSNLLEMRLSGTLREPRWTLTNNPFTTVRRPPLLPEKSESESTLTPTTPTDGEAEPAAAAEQSAPADARPPGEATAQAEQTGTLKNPPGEAQPLPPPDS